MLLVRIKQKHLFSFMFESVWNKTNQSLNIHKMIVKVQATDFQIELWDQKGNFSSHWFCPLLFVLHFSFQYKISLICCSTKWESHSPMFLCEYQHHQKHMFMIEILFVVLWWVWRVENEVPSSLRKLNPMCFLSRSSICLGVFRT
jgi:hypothetical protein